MFSIIMPLYNKSEFVLRAIQSVFDQNFTAWELIVVDDGSTDDSPLKVASLNSDRISLIEKSNGGVSSARNKGISIAKFPYLAFLDADDFWHRDYLFVAEKGISAFPDVGIWGMGITNRIEDIKFLSGNFFVVDDFFILNLWKSSYSASSVIIKSLFFQTEKGFNENLTRGEDLDVWYRAVCFFGKAVYCPDNLVYWERGDTKGATKSGDLLKRHLVSVILENNYVSLNEQNKDLIFQFHEFKFKYVLKRIVIFFKQKENYLIIEEILQKIPGKYWPITIVFQLPFPLLARAFGNNKVKKYYLKYLRLCFKFL